MSIHSMELITCADYGCPGCPLRHFHRTSDDSKLTEVPEVGMFTPERLASEIRLLLQEPGRLTGAASAAHSAGITDAAERLAEAVLQLIPSNNNGKSP